MCFQLFQLFIFGFAWNIFRFKRKRCSEKQVLDTGIHSLQYRTSTRTKQICMSSNLRSTLISVSKSWGQIQHIAVSENMKQYPFLMGLWASEHWMISWKERQSRDQKHTAFRCMTMHLTGRNFATKTNVQCEMRFATNTSIIQMSTNVDRRVCHQVTLQIQKVNDSCGTILSRWTNMNNHGAYLFCLLDIVGLLFIKMLDAKWI